MSMEGEINVVSEPNESNFITMVNEPAETGSIIVVGEADESNYSNLVSGTSEIESIADESYIPVVNEPNGDSITIVRLFFIGMVSGGLQFMCAVQMSLLIPYIQTLGVPHRYASMVWMGGPIAGFIINPLVGYYSDRCTMQMGRRRPFIIFESIVICISVLLIAFSVDIGWHLGDTKENCNTYNGHRWVAAVLCMIGFLSVDCTLHTEQATVRAMMSDLSAMNHGIKVGQAIFVVWMSIGNVLGYTAGAYGKWNRWFPILRTTACCDACAELKGVLVIAMVCIMISTIVTVLHADEKPTNNEEVDISTQTSGGCTPFIKIWKGLRDTNPEMRKLLALTAMTWFSWFPFLQFNTDWMGREVYHGNPNGTPTEINLYNTGVREGSVGLFLSSVTLGVTSFLIPSLCHQLTSKVVWFISLVSICLIMVGMVSIGIASTKEYSISSSGEPNTWIKALVLTMFSLTGIPLAVLYNVPWAVAAELAEGGGGGQGTTVGAMTFVIFLSQLIVGLTIGPVDGLFGKGNAPAFCIGGAIGLLCAILVALMLPRAARAVGVKHAHGVAAADFQLE